MVKIWLGTLISENVLKMIRAKRSAIFPLRIASAVALSYGYPVVPANGLSRSRVSLLKPWNYKRCFWFELTVCHVVVWESKVKWILARNECNRNITAASRRIGIIETAVVVRPIGIPRTSVVRNRIVAP